MDGKMRLRLVLLAFLAVLIYLLTGGCSNNFIPFVLRSGAPTAHVPELDSYVINLEGIQRTSNKEEIRALLGEPPFVHETYTSAGELLWTEWWYPVRSFTAAPLPAGVRTQRNVIPAVALKIWLDSSGRVKTWGFFHPVTNSLMEIRESIEQIDSWFEKMCNPPKRIELAVLLRRGRPKEEVFEGMRFFTSSLVNTLLERHQAHLSRDRHQEVLTYYADRPSPLYVPPDYVAVTFYAIGEFGTSWHFEGTYGGCK